MFFKKATILLVLGVLGISQMMIAPVKINHAEAATFSQYTLPFDFENTYVSNRWIDDENFISTEQLKIGKKAESALLYSDKNALFEHSITICGSRNSNTFYQSEERNYISSSEVEMLVRGTGFPTVSITITGEQSFKKSNSSSILLKDLRDGNYFAKISKCGVLKGNSYSGSDYYMAECITSFTVDTTAPIINGANISKTGIYTNKTFTVSAVDIGSGVKNLYMKSPNDLSFIAVGNTTTVSEESSAGLYSFYAIDNVNNRTATYYVNLKVCTNGHLYNSNIQDPTCTEKGGTVNICSVCGYSYMSDIKAPTGHSYVSVVETYATCTENGERRYTCETCGDSYWVSIPKTEHAYQIIEEELTDGTVRRKYTCKNCADCYTENLGKQYEKITNYVNYLFGIYSPYMVWVFLASAGVWSVVMGVMVVVASKNEEKEKAKKMIVNYGIGLIVIFGILIACPYLINGIASLIA